jgi:ABC-2 type transport system permease protein
LFKAFFTFAIPMLLVANVPAKLLVEKLSSPSDAVLLLVMSAACLALSEVGWRFSLRRYTSASS